MKDDDEPSGREIVEQIVADAHSSEAKQPGRIRGVLDRRTALVALLAIAVGFMAYSVILNQRSINENKRSTAENGRIADQAAATAKKAAEGQLAAVQLICTMERDLALGNTSLDRAEKSQLLEYDTELQCSSALSKPHQPLVLQPTPTPGYKSTTPPRGSSAPSGIPPAPGFHAESSTPPPRPHHAPSPRHSSHPPSHKPTPSPSPTPSCRIANPVPNPITGRCLLTQPV